MHLKMHSDIIVLLAEMFYDAAVMENLPALPIEKTVFEKTNKGKVIHSLFSWKDVGSLDDLDSISIQSQIEPQVISNKCENTTVINQSAKKLVLVNHVLSIRIRGIEKALFFQS